MMVRKKPIKEDLFMEQYPFRLTVMGLGGVGGLLAGPLLRRYGGAVSLVARGARGKALRENGLTLRSDYFGAFTVLPQRVAETPEELDVQDFVLVCVKNDVLESVAAQLRPIVGPQTLVVPVMNGVTAGEVLQKALPEAKVAPSVIYTVSGANADYSITQSGKFTHLFVDDLGGDAVAIRLAEIMKDAGIDWRLTSDIRTALWSKYVFNCAYNTMTAAESTDAGHLKRPPLRDDFAAIMAEAREVGCKCGAALPEDMVEKELRRLNKTTDDSESSLSRDFAKKRTGELEVFSGALLRLAAQCGVSAPTAQRYYEKLLEKAKTF